MADSEPESEPLPSQPSEFDSRADFSISPISKDSNWRAASPIFDGVFSVGAAALVSSVPSRFKLICQSQE